MAVNSRHRTRRDVRNVGYALGLLSRSCFGFASGGSSPEGQVSGMASALGVGLGWVVLAAIPSTSLRVITPAQGGPCSGVSRVWACLLLRGLGLGVVPPCAGVVRLGQVDGMAARTTRGLLGLAPSPFTGVSGTTLPVP